MSALVAAQTLTALGLSLLLGSAALDALRIARLPLWWSGLGAALLLTGAGLEVGSTLNELGLGLPDLLDFLQSTPQGRLALLRGLLAVLLLAAEVQSWSWLAWPCWALLLWAVGRAGHAGELGGVWVPVAALHAGAAAIWVGGVLGLVLRPPDLAATRRFTRLALSCLGALLLSGVAASLSHLPAALVWAALRGSTWGLTLLLKLGLLGLALLAALLVRRALTDRATGVQARRTHLIAEAALLLGVLGASGALATTPPPVTAQFQRQVVPVAVTLAAQPISGQLVLSGPGDVELRVSPALSGLGARLLMQGHPMPAQTLDMQPDGRGLRARTRVWMTGQFQLELSQGGEVATVVFAN
ncbi:CopD family protein [Deinococcus sp.]|uniref:CopD family protein n=1 Tax=Deinococcus sp. TaxID=47478 RepID=UPI0025EE80B1|nr:CopD family protein [Deinococcus sp.]